MHWASLLRMIFASLARAYQRVRIQNDFPQTKLGDPYVLFHNFNENNILRNWENYGYIFGTWNKGQ